LKDALEILKGQHENQEEQKKEKRKRGASDSLATHVPASWRCC